MPWRAGRNSNMTLDLQPGYGTLDWLVSAITEPAFEKLTPRSQPGYRQALKIILDIELKDGRRTGTLRLAQVSAVFADKVYAKVLLRGPRQAALCIALMRRAWKVVHRLHQKVVPASNPWVGVIQAKGATEEIVPHHENRPSRYPRRSPSMVMRTSPRSRSSASNGSNVRRTYWQDI